MDNEQQKLISEKILVPEKTLTDVLRLVSHGSELREALEKISKSNRGALIALDENARAIGEGGFLINAKFTHQRLVELSKMDGAIILDSKMKKIIYANTLLAPDMKIKSKETGTRHKAAERTAKQLNAVVLAVSEKSSIISVYYGNRKYTLNNITDLLYKARESIENLERQKTELDSLLKRFDSLELSSLVNIEDIAKVVEKIFLFLRDLEIAGIYVAELGRFGETIKIRYNLVSFGIRDELNNLEKDYSKYFNTNKAIKLMRAIKKPSVDEYKKVLESFLKEQNSALVPYGYRILAKMQLGNEIINELINEFKDIKGIFFADDEKLREIIKDEKKAKQLRDFLTNRVVLV